MGRCHRLCLELLLGVSFAASAGTGRAAPPGAEAAPGSRPPKAAPASSGGPSAGPPVLSLVELRVVRRGGPGGPALNKRVRVAHPQGWTGDAEANGRSIRLFGPAGEGEMLIATATHPSELGAFLEGLRRRHPSAAPSPPQHIDVHGIKPHRGERATRFEITGGELGEMVMIERGEVIVLFATIVRPSAWPTLEKQLSRCYPTVEVSDVRSPGK